MVVNIPIPEARIAEFCRKWRIAEFSLFGSVLRDDFRPAHQPGDIASQNSSVRSESSMKPVDVSGNGA